MATEPNTIVIEHPTTGAKRVIANQPKVIELYRRRGWIADKPAGGSSGDDGTPQGSDDSGQKPKSTKPKGKPKGDQDDA